MTAMEADDVERARVAVNRQAGEEAGAARQPRAGRPEDLPVGETTTGDDGADAGRVAGSTAPVDRFCAYHAVHQACWTPSGWTL